MKIKKNFFIYFLSFQLLFISFAQGAATCALPKINHGETFTRLCNNIDDIICKDVPDRIRRSCDERDKTIIHKGMTAGEVFNFAKGCIKSVATSFKEFFTVFLPDLCKAIWSLSKGIYENVKNPGGFLDSLKGYYESARSLAADVYEAINKDPGEFFAEIWQKIIDAVGPVIAGYDCMNPQAKVEKICGVIGEWVMPPAILAKVIVKGSKAAKELYELKLLSKIKKAKPAGLDAFKLKYAQELKLSAGANKNFIAQVEADIAKKETNVLYFDVENSVQKKLNDDIFKEKTAVDAFNNSFFIKLNEKLHKNPDLMARLGGEYKDYKSYRVRLKLKPGDDPKKYQLMLAALYKETNEDFFTDPLLAKVRKEIPPRTDNLSDPATWFLSGAGNNALEANMAARAARKNVGSEIKPPSMSHFREHVGVLAKEIDDIEDTRKALAANKSLLEKGIMEKAANGNVIPSKSMIGILRKIKPDEFQTEAEFLAKISSKAKELFGASIDQKTARSLAAYFKKVDSLSPPLFSAERVAINLNEASKGIVSIDFAGIGVDNIYGQMKALSEVGYKNKAERKLQESFAKMQDGVNEVTNQMEDAKNVFRSAVSKIDGTEKKGPQFSGDDGIFMPGNRLWNTSEKSELVKHLAKSSDPSKFRVTFVSSTYSEGKIIPAAERSKRIVRAETLEKDIRSKIIGAGKISESEGKKIITAIDYAPSEKGGKFNLILGGKNFTPAEIKTIEDAFRSSLKGGDGEKFGKVIYSAH